MFPPHSYVVKEMEETEREYIRDLKMLVETYMDYITSHREMVPEIVSANVDTVFSNIVDILKFHDRYEFLPVCIQNVSVWTMCS